MCGIIGVYCFENELSPNEICLKKSVKIIHHRGPDAHGIKIINKKVGFGHVRLSIIDLSTESNNLLYIIN